MATAFGVGGKGWSSLASDSYERMLEAVEGHRGCGEPFVERLAVAPGPLDLVPESTPEAWACGFRVHHG